MKYVIWSVFILTTVSGGCAHVMSDGGLASTDRSISYADIRMNPEVLSGRNVLVGGIIADTRSSGDMLQLEVSQRALFSNGVPDESSHSEGRFIVISGELPDPSYYHPGGLITIIGEIKGQITQPREGAVYRYPLISAREIRLFRASDSISYRPANPYQNQIDDNRFMLRPPGAIAEDPLKP